MQKLPEEVMAEQMARSFRLQCIFVIGSALVLGVVMIVIFLLAVMSEEARADNIPRDAQQHQRELTRNARLVWGIDAPVSTFAAQIHTESRWRPGAVSPAGAQGIAQFMPTTTTWIAGLYPRSLGDADPFNPAWSMRALLQYDLWLWNRIAHDDSCERMAMVMAAYNGGLGWVQRDVRLARVAANKSASGKGPDSADNDLKWFDGVERFNSGRSTAAFAENRAYPRLILKVREPIYEAAGWGIGSCQ
jgi:soluble lytic murein transglycosylase-like protein